MLRVSVGFLLGLLLAAAPCSARAEASLKLLESPVVAGKVVRLRVVVPGGIQAPLRGVAALGTVGPFARTAPNTYEADYVVAAGTGPAQAEIVVFEDRVGGALAYALANIQDQVHVRAKSRPKLPTFVRAGPERRGPFHPNAHGEVELAFPANGELTEVELETAQGKAIDRVPLKPTLAKTLAIGRPSRLHAGETGPLEVLLVVPYERAFKFEAPRAQASAGELLLDLKGSPDEAVRYTLAPGNAAPPIEVKLVDSFGKVVGTTTFTEAGPRPTRLALQLPEEPLSPRQRASLQVQLTDDHGQPAEGMLDFDVSDGSISPPVERGPGTYEVAYTAPARGAASIHIVARVLGEKARAEGEIAMRGGKPAKVVFKPTGEARAGEVVSVVVQVLDAAGNPTHAEGLSVAAENGEVAALRDQGGGRFLVDVKAPPDAPALVLSARDGDLELKGHQTIELSSSGALPFALIGPEGGFSNNFGKVSTPSISVAGAFLVGPQSSTVGSTLGFLAGYLPESQRTLVSDQSTSGTLELSRVALLARAGAFGGLGNLGLFGGVQGGALKLSGQLVSLGRAPLALDSWRPAVGLYAGAGYKLGPGFLSVEARATYANVDLQSDVVRVKGPVGGVDGALGYLFTL